MVPTQSSHQRKLLAYLISVLGVDTRCCFVDIKTVVIQTNTCRNTMMLIKICFKHQRGISIALVGIVLFMTIECILMMQRARKNQGDVRTVFWVDDKGILGKSLVAFVGDVDSIGVRGVSVMTDLSSLTMFFQPLDGCLEDITVAHVGPTAHQRALAYFRHIHKAIVIFVVCLVE